jgi:hypothetical protein
MHFNFIAADHFDLKYLDTVESFVEAFGDFQTVWLKNENELISLFTHMGLPAVIGSETDNPLFPKIWDLSGFKLPELDSEQFDLFYDDWIKKSGRAIDMNEYGSLLFLQGLSFQWNKLKYRLVITETSNGA